ncbi:MAG TPA: FmdB family zinc ribbon protein [Jatrophihabitans sp.]|jgi:putative FmdB family regulatory protein|uniref:FmdB family zinc ribbon protein n=1 Tax=Jatrophihabitans sp. TaxID=1932789 RepID=UPI002EF2FAB0
MPTYQYACTSDQCGLRFERVQAFTDPAVSECPDCSERVRKVYSSVGVVFKGSGFYRNDSREAAKTGASAKSDSDGAAKNGNGGKDTGKADAAKSESGSGSAKSAESSGSGSSGSGKGSAESSSKGKTESAKPAASVAS